MSKLTEWILKEAEGAEIQGVVIGKFGWGDYGTEEIPNYQEQPRGKLISWEEAQKWLNYEFNSGYGAPKCNSVYVWTPTKVMFVVQYDGSTSLHSVPRNPVDCTVEMPGG
jgi:hypothetical protein